jgi:hypothetical protein
MGEVYRRGTQMKNAIGMLACGVLLLAAPAGADEAKYSAMAPLEQYMMAPADEIALARSAAPPSISDAAEVMVLTSHGYETAAKGTNGWLCLVERGWNAGFDDPVFWNQHIRGPICFNPGAVRTVVPAHLQRAQWVLAGLSRDEMRTRAKASALANAAPAPGAMCFMMSKDQYLSDSGGHWHPHLMFYVSNGAADWGANLKGSPVLGGPGDPEPVTTFMVPVTKWSDGTPDLPGSPAMKM